ncbi:MAG: ABC transporter substrate-binding protein [Chloroflexi bacterium]|nr:ABC transporter substrate-binding protein [Chloroflexota bacterium]
MKKKFTLLLASLLTLLLVLSACQPETITVEVTRVVTETVEVEGESVEVTRVVTETEEVQVEVTRIVETEVEVEVVDPAMAERARTVIFDIDSGSVADPELWNPFAAGRRLDHGLMQAMIEPLFILNLESPTGEVINWLGESIEANEDATVWTIKLREGIKWSDGETLDADDFLFTVEMGMGTSDLMSMPSFSNVASVEKLDDLTLQFTLTETDHRFGYDNFTVTSTSSFFIAPQHIWEGQDPTTFTNYDPDQGWPVFSGPYLLESVSETEFTYVRNDDWWGVNASFNLPAPEKLVWVAYGSEETRTAAMARNELDSLMGVNLGSYLALQQMTGTTIAWHADLPYAWIDPCARNLHFNLTVEPWNDVEMREAVNYALNRDQIVDITYEGTAPVSQHWLPAYNAFNGYVQSAVDAGLYDQYPLLTHDQDMTRAIFEDKGYTLNAETGYYEINGEELTMSIANFDDTSMNNAVALMVEQFQAVGINASQDIQPIPAFIENLTNAGFDTYYFFVCGPIDLWSKMDTFSTRHIPAEGEASSGFYANTQRWDGPEAQAYSDIIAQMVDVPPGDPQLEGLFLEAMEIWLAEKPALPIVQAIKLVPFNEAYWTGWPTADNPYIAPATWWQVNHVILQNLEPVQP